MIEREGYIKFNIEYVEKECPEYEGFIELNNVRSRLFEKRFIGSLENGVGYGNLSMRIENSLNFIISGSKTGRKRILAISDYSKVEKFNIKENTISCYGMCKASSESLSHAAVYFAAKDVKCVIHIHNKIMWEYLLNNNFPSTSKEAEFGTPEIAEDILRLVKSKKNENGIFAMAGHVDGVIAYGCNILEAEKILNNIISLIK